MGQPLEWLVLQDLKDNPLFGAIGGARLHAAIDAILDGAPYPKPKNWGALFVAFPTQGGWAIPTSGWHIDAKYTSALWPAGGAKTHALFGDIPPRAGGTLIVAGSHRLVSQWFKEHPPPPDARGADMRRLLQAHPYIRDLHTRGERQARIARFMDRAEEIDGVSLRVVENTGAAGDVILLHPLVLHVAAPNTGSQPRFLLSGGVTTNGWGFP